MNILYFGTVCDLNSYNAKLKYCKEVPSIAPIVFESALLEGLYQKNAEMEIYSFPMIPTFPKSDFLFFGGNREYLSCGYCCQWLKTVNLPILKQISRRLDARKIMKKWMQKNSGDGVVVTYSVPPFLIKDLIKYAKRYNIKTVAIIPDLVKDMYINDKSKTFISKLKKIYLSSAIKMQGMYSGYIYLTEKMHNVVAPDRPYMVMEGIASLSDVPEEYVVEKTVPCAVMYAGMLYEKYGIMSLIDAFEAANIPNVELWLFGDGTAVDQIKQRAKINPKIKYYGMVSRKEILEYERKATLLVNPRNPQEEFTKYSFPSKTIEYMLSGTPLLSTRLEGIPAEYFDYMFSIEDNDVKNLSCAISEVFSHSKEELMLFGEKARCFIENEKNEKIQAARVLNFLNEVIYETSNK